MKTCENCGSRVYSLGCTWCNEEAYIEQQTHFDALHDRDRKAEQRAGLSDEPPHRSHRPDGRATCQSTTSKTPPTPSTCD